MEEEDYIACIVCEGQEGYKWDDGMPQLCESDDQDRTNEEERILITAGALSSIRRPNWRREKREGTIVYS